MADQQIEQARAQVAKLVGDTLKEVVEAQSGKGPTADSTFSVREVALGLAADVGTLKRLPKICGNQSWVVCLTTHGIVTGSVRVP